MSTSPPTPLHTWVTNEPTTSYETLPDIWDVNNQVDHRVAVDQSQLIIIMIVVKLITNTTSIKLKYDSSQLIVINQHSQIRQNTISLD